MKKIIQKIFLITMISVILLGVTGCSLFTNSTGNATTTATPDPNATMPPQQVVDAEYKLYDENKYFSIQYQGEWMIKSNLSDDGTIDLDSAEVTFTIPEGMVQSETDTARIYPTFSVFRFEIAEEERENFNLNSYATDQVSYLEKNLYQFTLLQEITEVQIGNVTAYTISHVGSILNTNEVRTKQAFLTDGTAVYIITYAANAEFYDNENYLAIAEKMMNTFMLK